MTEIWDATFSERRVMWGHEPTHSALRASNELAQRHTKTLLIPGIGYGRNAKPFLERGMTVTGIEISQTAIEMARTELGLDLTIHHGSVTDMPFDGRRYDGIFCYGLLYLLDAAGRAKVARACYEQLTAGGRMIFVVITKDAPMYGKGQKLGDDWFEIHPGLPMFFYDEAAVERELGAYGIVECSRVDEPVAENVSFPFLYVVCQKP